MPNGCLEPVDIPDFWLGRASSRRYRNLDQINGPVLNPPFALDNGLLMDVHLGVRAPVKTGEV